MLSTAPIVVVDDDPAVLGGLIFALESDGYRVCACASAAVALKMTPREAACLVVDQLLPDMQGLDLIKALRTLGVSAPAILITSPSPAIKRQAVAAGVRLVAKPLLTDELFTEIRLAMGRRSA